MFKCFFVSLALETLSSQCNAHISVYGILLEIQQNNLWLDIFKYLFENIQSLTFIT